MYGYETIADRGSGAGLSAPTATRPSCPPALATSLPPSKRPLRIAMLSFHTSPLARPGGRGTGGMNVYVRELSQELGRLGYQVDIFTRRTDRRTPRIVTLISGVRLITLTAGPLAADKDDLYQHVPRFLSAVSRFRREHGVSYDLIHSHYWLSGVAGRQLAAAWGVPHITMFHTLGAVKNRARRSEREPRYRIEEEAAVARSADRIIIASEHERALLTRLYDIDPAKVSVIPLGVDLDQFRPIMRAVARHALGLNGKGIILFVGRVEPLKGLDLLLSAAAQISEESDFELLVVGADASTNGELAHLRQLAADLGLAGRVRFIGAVEHELLPLFYNAADVCVVPSYYESFGLVALEAMACGVPVVAARVGGLASTIRDGETGYLIPWHCPEPFAERLELLLMNEDLRRHLGQQARAAAERYRWSNIAHQIASLYEELAGNLRPSGPQNGEETASSPANAISPDR